MIELRAILISAIADFYDAISEYRVDKIKLINSEELQISRGKQKEVQRIMIGYMG